MCWFIIKRILTFPTIVCIELSAGSLFSIKTGTTNEAEFWLIDTADNVLLGKVPM